MIGDILQPTHLLFVLVVALIVLGPKRLPEAGRSLGRGLRDFKEALTSDPRDDHEELVSAVGAPAAAAQSTPVAAAAQAPSVPPAPAPAPATDVEPAEHSGA